MKYEKSCGAVVYQFRKHQIWFLVEHMIQGHTSIPKGHVEGEETEEETAVREIREETGLEVRLDTVFRDEISYSPYTGIQKQVIFFAAEALPGDMKNQESEVSSLEWLPYDDAIRTVTYDQDREVLKHAAAYLSVKHGKTNPIKEFGYVWYREHAADIHSHIVPGVDDGAQALEEAIELLKRDREEGVRAVFATPHYGIENGFAPKAEDVRSGFSRLCEAAREAVPGMKIYPGTEWYCSDRIVERIRNREAFPMGSSDWYMVEFLEYGGITESAEVMLRRLKKMKDNGIKTILAHAERYQALQEDRDLAKRICDLGVLLQVNAYDLYLNKNDDTRNLAQWMAKEKMISFLGSDMHGLSLKKKSPKMKEGIRWLYENVDEEYANDVVRVNAERYLGVEKLPG